MLATSRQFVFGAGRIDEVTDERVRIGLIKVVNRFELAPEEAVAEAVFSPADVVAAWQSATSELKNPGFIGEHWDESLQITVRGYVCSVSLYRATVFKQKAEPAG